MKLIVATEAHFMLAPDGRLYSDTGGRGYDFWTRYLEVFDSVTLLARVSASPEPGASAVEGPGVTVVRLPGYHGPEQYLRHRKRVRRLVRSAITPDVACLARVPGTVGALLVRQAVRAGSVYGLEVVGDPLDALSPGAIKHPLRAFFRRRFTRDMRWGCNNATAVAYVTEKHLQTRYPAAIDAFTTHFSSVELPDGAFVQAGRPIERPPRPAILIHVGTQSQWYKGHDVLIDAVSKCVHRGLDLKLRLVGDGKHRAELERRVAVLGLSDCIQFLGQLPSGSEVWKRLDEADLFVMPSRTEGLPRAMIEAMARGLPCIGTDVGGIPELLPLEDLVPPADAKALSNKIEEVLASCDRMRAMSARNIEGARKYDAASLREKRIAFYKELQTRTEQWATRKGLGQNG